jgi:hypothetical protein
MFQTARHVTHQWLVSLTRRNGVLLRSVTFQTPVTNRKVHKHGLSVPSVMFPLFRLASSYISFHKSSRNQHHLSYIRFLHTFALIRFDIFAVITKSPLLFIPSTIPHAMAHSHSEGISHTHTRPGSKCCNLRDQLKHVSQQPYQDKLDVGHTSSHIPASGDIATKGSSAFHFCWRHRWQSAERHSSCWARRHFQICKQHLQWAGENSRP